MKAIIKALEKEFDEVEEDETDDPSKAEQGDEYDEGPEGEDEYSTFFFQQRQSAVFLK